MKQLLTVCILLATLSFAPQLMAQVRGRPHLNAARTTFVADNGQPCRPVAAHDALQCGTNRIKESKIQ